MDPQPQLVQLYVYDLSSGLASFLSPTLLGRHVEGVWHTSVVVFEREFFYGSGGITSCAPGGTALGAPLRVDRLGVTQVPYAVFLDYLEGLATTSYAGPQYHLLEHNCNHFSDEVASFLCGARLPKAIVQQGEQALPPALRAAVTALLAGMVPQATPPGGVRRVRQESPDYARLNSSIEEASQTVEDTERARLDGGVTWRGAGGTPTDVPPTSAPRRSAWRDRLRRGGALLAMLVHSVLHPADNVAVGAALGARRDALAEKLLRKQRRKEAKERKKKGKHEADAEEVSQPGDMAEALTEPPATTAGPSSEGEEEPDARTAAELRRRELCPPILFTEFDGAQEFEALVKTVESVQLSQEDDQSLDELKQYLVQNEGSWVLGDEFMAFVGRTLSSPELEALRSPLLRCLCAAALRDDISLVLHQDRKHHAIINHAQGIDRLPKDEQLHIAILMVNLFSNISSSEWLLYISEWEYNNQQISNIRVTTKVCVHTMLSEDASQRRAGTALLYNLTAKEVKTVRLRETRPLRDLLPRGAKAKVFDEVCAELALAALQLASNLVGEGGQSSDEECLWRCLASLARLVTHSQDVPQLVAMVGPDPNMFRGMSPRVDEQIDLVMQRVK